MNYVRSLFDNAPEKKWAIVEITHKIRDRNTNSKSKNPNAIAHSIVNRLRDSGYITEHRDEEGRRFKKRSSGSPQMTS